MAILHHEPNVPLTFTTAPHLWALYATGRRRHLLDTQRIAGVVVDDEESKMMMDNDDAMTAEAAALDGYFSDAPLDPKPKYPALNESMDTAIIITNLPKVKADKIEKLQKVILKLVSKIGPLRNVGEEFTGLLLPTTTSTSTTTNNNNDDAEPAAGTTATTLGFCFVDFQSVEHARNAVVVLQDYKFDKNHSLAVCLFHRAEQLSQINTGEFQAPAPVPFQEKPNPTVWLQDMNQRDEFVMRYGKETVVKWFDGRTEPTVDYDGEREKEAGVAWCDSYVHFSPAGSYLATLVPSKGVILWSGQDYQKTARFPAPGVQLVVFSPQENYLLTNNERPDDPAAIKIFHIPTGTLVRAFPLYPEDVIARDNKQQLIPPPPFLWSHDDKYLARMGANMIRIYETPSMGLLEKRSLIADGIKEFQWCPTNNIIAYWAPEENNAPAHVDLIEIPSRKKLRQKNLFNVTRCMMVWHAQGDYLAVKVTRHTKSKKTMYNNIELFRVNDTAIPVEMLDMKDAVMALQFEPHGSRFAMIHAENPNAAKVKVSFYDMMKTEETTVAGIVGAKQAKTTKTRVPELHLIETLEGRQCNFISWSPAGHVIIMASLGDSASGTLEFYDVSSKALVIKEHYRANQLLWDPAGRSVASVVSQPMEGGSFKFAMDNGYVLWSFQGKQLYQESYEAFYQFIWRPRKTLLSSKKIHEVRRNLKKYEKQFDKADRKRRRQKYLEETKGKREERARIRDIIARNSTIVSRHRQKHIALLGGYDSDDEKNYQINEMLVEKVLSTKEETIVL